MACAQNFALWQQATIEITRRDHSIIACSHHTYIYFCSSRTSRSWWITQSTQCYRRGCNNIPSFLQWTTPIARSFVWRLNSARSSHLGHSTILLRSEIPSGICAKLRTVAASNNRDHSIIACLRHAYIFLFFPHIQFVVNHTINTTPPDRLQQSCQFIGFGLDFAMKLLDWIWIKKRKPIHLYLLICVSISLFHLRSPADTTRKFFFTYCSVFPFAATEVGLPNAFCKNNCHFVKSDRSRLHS